MSTESHNVDSNAEVAGTEADKINTGALGTLVAVGLFAMISITSAVTALVRHDIELEEAQKDADANQVVTDLKASQRGVLNGPAGYVDRAKGLVSLPIELAKGLVISELAKDPNSATPPAPAKPEATGGGTGAAVDGAAGAATLASGGASGQTEGAAKAGAGPKPEETKPAASGTPEQGRNVVKPTPATSAKPSPVPTPTPTAASPGALSPGPINH